MSVEAIKAVWQIPIQPAGRKLVMLNLADCQNATTKLINPSISAISKACNLTPSQVKRHLAALKDTGLVIVTANKFGGSPGATPHYQLNLQIPFDDARGSVDATGSADATGSVDAQEGAHPCAGGVAPMLPKPEGTGKNRKEREQDKPAVSVRKKNQEQTFSDWYSQITEAGEKAISDYKGVWDFAEKIGLPAGWIDLAWQKFKRDHLTNQKKRQRDWRLTFLTYCRNGYLNLWKARRDGTFYLSDAGVMLAKELGVTDLPHETQAQTPSLLAGGI